MDIWPAMVAVDRIDEETDDDFARREGRIREIQATFRHRYYTPKQGAAMERELERLEASTSRRRKR